MDDAIELLKSFVLPIEDGGPKWSADYLDLLSEQARTIISTYEDQQESSQTTRKAPPIVVTIYTHYPVQRIEVDNPYKIEVLIDAKEAENETE